jgi:hypothetical protein
MSKEESKGFRNGLFLSLSLKLLVLSTLLALPYLPSFKKKNPNLGV